MTNLTETILSIFPEFKIAPLEGVPTQTYMTEVNGFLNECAESVHCNLGNGTVGYLVLTAQPAPFLITSPTSFVKPVNPGVLILRDPAQSADVIGSLTRQHTEDTRVFNKYHSVDRACKKSFVHYFRRHIYCHSRTSTPGTRTYNVSKFCHTYGVRTGYFNTIKCKKWCQDEKSHLGRNIIWRVCWKIDTAVDTVETQAPYTRQQIVSIAFTMVENAMIYYNGVKEWRQKDTADKTWESFKTFFAREFREIRVQSRTSVSEGYRTTTNMRGVHANAAEFEM